MSRDSLDRAFRILDTFIKEWEQIGGTVRIGAVPVDQSPGTLAEMHGDQVSFELFEVVDRTSTDSDATRNWRYQHWKYQPTGKLVLQLDPYGAQSRRRWADGKRQNLELMLGSFIRGAIAVLDARRECRLDEECVARQNEALKATRERAKKMKEAEDQR